MSAVPIREDERLRSAASPDSASSIELDPLLTMSRDQLRGVVESDAARVEEFRAEEVRRQLSKLGTPTALQEQAVSEAVGSMRTIDLLRRHSEAFRLVERMGELDADITSPQQRASQIALDVAIERSPKSGFVFDAVGALVRSAQDMALSANAIAASVTGAAATILPEYAARPMREAAAWMDESRDSYRELVMTGRMPFGGGTGSSLLQDLNYRGSKDTWGARTGTVAFYALPAAGSVLRGMQSAKTFSAGVMGLMGMASAGQGIDAYRNHELNEGRTPNPWKAIGVGVGYAAVEILAERLDSIPFIRRPWAAIGPHAASHVATRLMQLDARGAASYLLNAIGHAHAEGLEEVVTGEFQAMIDAGAFGGGNDRTWLDRVREYGGGAAGSGMTTLAGSFSPVFREAMRGAPSPMSRSQVERKLIADFETFAATPAGQASALARAVMGVNVTAGSPTAKAAKLAATDLAERMGKPDLAARLTAAVERDIAPRRVTSDLVSEFQLDIRRMTGQDAAVRVVGEREQHGIRIIEVEGDGPLPFPGYATSERNTVIVEKGHDEFGTLAHEIVHTFPQEHPEVYAELVQATGGAVLGYAATYAKELAAAGGTTEGMTASQIVEEGAARMVQAVAGAAGLKSRLSPTQVGVLTKIADHIRRRAAKLGLRGPVVKSVLTAFDALENAALVPEKADSQRPEKTDSTANGAVAQQSELDMTPWRRTGDERFGMFATRRSGDDQMVLPFGTELAKALEELRDVSIPAPPGGTVQATTFTDPRPTQRPHMAAVVKIQAAKANIADTFRARRIAQANLKLDLAAAMQVAIPGKAGQAFANRILDAKTEAELRAIVSAAHAAYVNLTSREASLEAQGEIERIATLLADNETPASVRMSEREKLAEMLRQYRGADRGQRAVLRESLKAQRSLAAEERRAAVAEERAKAQARVTDIRQGFAEERAKARRKLADALTAFRAERSDTARQNRERLAELRRTMLARMNQVRARFAEDRRLFEEMQKNTADLIGSVAPMAVRGKFLKALPRARTDVQMQKLLNRVEREMERHERRVALATATKAVKAIGKRKLHPAEHAQLVYLAQSVGLDTDKIPVGKSRSSQRRAIVRGVAQLLRELKIPTDDLDTVTAQAKGILDRWCERQDGLLNSWKIAVKDRAGKLAAELEQHSKALKADLYGRPSRVGPTAQMLLGFASLGHMDAETMAEFVFGRDSLGVVTFHRDIREGYAAKLRTFHEAQDYIHDALQRLNIDLGGIDLAQMSEGIARSMGRSPLRMMKRVKPIVHSVKLPSGSTIDLTEAEWVWAVGHALAPYNRSMAENGYGLWVERTAGNPVSVSSADLDHLVATAPQHVRAIHDAMREYFNNTAQPLVRDRMIEAIGYDNTVPDYWPADRQRAAKPTDVEEEIPNALIAAKSIGMMQERVGGKDALVVKDAFIEFLRHAWVVSGIAHQSRGIEFANAAIDSQEFRSSSERSGFVDYRNHLKNYLRDVAREYQGTGQDLGDRYFDRVLQRIRNNVVKGTLGLSPRTAMMQTVGIATLTTEMNPADVTRAVVTGAMFRLELDKQIRSSPFLRQRMDSSPIRLATGDQSGTPGIYGTKPEGHYLMLLNAAVDNTVVRVAMQAATYAAERRMRGATPEAIAAEALRNAERAILRTQPTTDPIHQSAIGREARRSGGVALLTMFMSSFNKSWNILARSAIRARREKSPAALSHLAYTASIVVGGQAIGGALVAQLFNELIAAVGGDDDDTRLGQRIARDMVQNSLGIMYGGAYLTFLGQGLLDASGISRQNVLSPSASPVADTLRNLVMGLVMSARHSGQRDDVFWRNAEKSAVAAAQLSGVPLAPYRLLRKALSEDVDRTQPSSRRSRRRSALSQ